MFRGCTLLRQMPGANREKCCFHALLWSLEASVWMTVALEHSGEMDLWVCSSRAAVRLKETAIQCLEGRGQEGGLGYGELDSKRPTEWIILCSGAVD